MKLQVNESTPDRVVRAVVGIVLLAAVVFGAVVAPWAYLAGFAGALLVVTGIAGFCPLYAILRISTLPARR